MEITLPRTEEIFRVTSTRDKVSAKLVKFLSESGFAVNLAIFRTVLFAVLLLSPDFHQSIEYSAVPKQLMFPPAGLGALLASLPISPSIDSAATVIFALLSFSALIGFHTRKCALGAALIGLYVLGIPQLFGKVKHETPELLWFAFILSASDCGRVFSVDAALKSWRQAHCQQERFLRPSMRYGVPLHLIWLLMGILYFFPGFWKLHRSGLAWALSDNLRWTILDKAVVSHHLPFLHVYDNPWLYQLAGLGTFAFELSFIALVFTAPGRLFLALAGELFHTGIWLCIGIAFFELQACYVALINWQRLFSWAGQRLFPEMLLVEYASDDFAARRFLSVLDSFDLLGRLEMRASKDPAGALKASVGTKSLQGAEACALIMRRSPLMWLIKPFWPMIANKVVNSRSPGESSTQHLNIETAKPKDLSLVPVVTVGLILVAGNLWCGCHQILQAWPVACYPCFSELGTPQTMAMRVSAWGPDGKKIELGAAMKVFSRGRREGFWRSVLQLPARQRDEKLKVLWSYLVERDPKLAGASIVSFDSVTLEAAPELWSRNPVAVDPLVRIKISH